MPQTDPAIDTLERARLHGWVAKLLLWSTAALLLFAYNADVTNALRGPAAMAFEARVGIVVRVAFALRYAWMHLFNGGASRLPAAAPGWEHWVSRLSHHSLYLCVAAIVATGLLIPFAQSHAPNLIRAASDLYEFVTGLTPWIIGAHVAAALWHKLVRRDGDWEAIGTPRWSWLRLPGSWLAWIDRLASRLPALLRRSTPT
jgi:cytochrome b561